MWISDCFGMIKDIDWDCSIIDKKANAGISSRQQAAGRLDTEHVV